MQAPTTRPFRNIAYPTRGKRRPAARLDSLHFSSRSYTPFCPIGTVLGYVLPKAQEGAEVADMNCTVVSASQGKLVSEVGCASQATQHNMSVVSTFSYSAHIRLLARPP